MELDKVADMVADIVANMVVDEVTDMVVEEVADMVADTEVSSSSPSSTAAPPSHSWI